MAERPSSLHVARVGYKTYFLDLIVDNFLSVLDIPLACNSALLAQILTRIISELPCAQPSLKMQVALVLSP